MEKNGLLIPPKFHTFKQDEHNMLGNREEEFLIINRPFNEVDVYFSQKISKTIEKLLSASGNEKVRVLDLAGGTKSQAVRDLQKKYGERVLPVNLDFAQNIKGGIGAYRIQADATLVPIANSSIDIVFSCQFLPFIKRFSHEHYPAIKKVFSEVSRILKPEGIAFLDDEEEISGPDLLDKRLKLANELGIILETQNSATLVVERGGFSKLWAKKIRPRKFLVLKNVSK